MEKKFAKDAAERLKRAAMYGNDGRTDYSRKRSRRKTSCSTGSPPIFSHIYS